MGEGERHGRRRGGRMLRRAAASAAAAEGDRAKEEALPLLVGVHLLVVRRCHSDNTSGI